MDNNEAFEKWFESKLAESRANNDLDMHRNLTRYVGFYKYGFEAAQQQSAGEIADLKVRIGDVTQAYQEKVNELKADNERSQAQVNEFRYLLELCQNGLRWYQDTHPEDASPEDDELHVAINYRLNKTPAQCLIEHDNEVIERCAEELEKNHDMYYVADSIRKLKGTP